MSFPNLDLQVQIYVASYSPFSYLEIVNWHNGIGKIQQTRLNNMSLIKEINQATMHESHAVPHDLKTNHISDTTKTIIL